MKVLVTGARGQLGTDLVDVLIRENDVFGFSHQELDITKPHKVLKIVNEIKPDIVIHSAAYTDVDGCELNPEKAYRVNALGTKNVALACQESEIPLVYISTDYVFDGIKSQPYLESDVVNPINVYGKSKLEGEKFVQSLLKKFFIIRTSWLYGKRGRNFVKTILNLAQNQRELKIVNDQVGSPTYTLDLAQKISELIEFPYYGIYHITNQGFCSWFEFAREIIGGLSLKGIRIIPIESRELNRPARRPSYSVLENYSLKLKGLPLLRDWKSALKEFLSVLKSNQ